MPSTVRLLVVGVSLNAETFISRLLDGLADGGIEVSVAATRVRGVQSSLPTNLKLVLIPAWSARAFVRLSYLAVHGVRALLVDPRFVWALWRRGTVGARARRRVAWWSRLLPLAGGSWDVFYFPWLSSAVENEVMFDLGVPVIVSCRGSQVNVAPHNPMRGGLVDGMRRIFAKAAAVHCVSDAIKVEAAALGLDEHKAHVIRAAVDSRFFSPRAEASRADGVVRVVSVGRLVWVKGHEYGLSALAQLRAAGHDVTLDVVGEGPDRQRVLYTIDDLGLQGAVRLRGRLAPDGVRDALRDSDIFLLPSFSEGICNAVIEAMACGLPVVSTDCGGIAEAVADGVEGFIVPTYDSGRLADALLRLIVDAELRQRMGRAARQRVLDEFSTEKQLEAFVRLVTEVAEDAQRKAADG